MIERWVLIRFLKLDISLNNTVIVYQQLSQLNTICALAETDTVSKTSTNTVLWCVFKKSIYRNNTLFTCTMGLMGSITKLKR